MRTAEDIQKEREAADRKQQKNKRKLEKVKAERQGNVELTTKALDAFKRREHT